MSVSFQIVVCGSFVPDPLQTLEPVTGPAGPALKNELMLPAVLDPWAGHALFEAAHLAQAMPGSKVWLVSLGAKAKLQQFTAWGYGKLPVCIAKTQYSFTDDPKILGAPSGWTLHVTDASLSAGAGFVVVISGSIMLMPGLPKVSRAVAIDVTDSGEITGV